jgi:hypothetical protein
VVIAMIAETSFPLIKSVDSSDAIYRLLSFVSTASAAETFSNTMRLLKRRPRLKPVTASQRYPLALFEVLV